MKLACLAALLAAFAGTRSAAACGQIALPEPSLKGAPTEGQTDVPTDVVPVVNLVALNLSSGSAGGHFALRTESGEAVATTLEDVANGFVAIHPKSALQAHTAYVIEVTLPQYAAADAVVSLTFATGASPAAPPQPLELTSLQFWTAPGPDYGCGVPHQGACIALPTGEWVQVRYPWSNVSSQASTYLYNGPSDSAIVDETLLHEGRCIELRRRALNGVLSEPSELCGADLPSVQLSGGAVAVCTEQGVSASGGDLTVTQVVGTPYNDLMDDEAHDDVTNTGASCALAHRPTSQPLLASLIVLGAALARRAASRRR